MTTTEPTTTDEYPPAWMAEGARTMTLPTLTVPAGHDDKVAEALALVESLAGSVKHLGGLMDEIRAVNDGCLGTVRAAGLPVGNDDVHELVGRFTLWLEVWEAVATMADALDADSIPLSNLNTSEV